MDLRNALATSSGERPSNTAAEEDLSTLAVPSLNRRDFHKHALAGALALFGLERAAEAAEPSTRLPARSVTAGGAFGMISESRAASGPTAPPPALGQATVGYLLDSVREYPLLVASILKMLVDNPSMGIAAADAKGYLAHTDPRVRSEAANLVASRREIAVDFASLEPLIHDRDAGVRRSAIAAITKRTDVAIPNDILSRLERSHHFRSRRGPVVDTEILDLIDARRPPDSLRFLRRHYLRTGKNESNQDVALQVLAARKDLVARLGVHEIVRCASSLTAGSLGDGNELRLGRLLADRLSAGPGIGVDKERLQQLAMPLLRMLCKVDRRYPELLAKMSPRASLLFAREALGIIEKAREEEIGERRLARKEHVNLLVGLHNEYCFERDEMRRRIKDLVRPARANLVGIFKSVYDDEFEDLAMMYGIATEEELRAGTLEAKKGFLDGAARLAADRTTPGFVWCAGHGGSKHFWLSCGAWGSSETDRLDHPQAISYREMARTLVDAQIVDAPRKTIDLSHLTIIQDACLQHDFVNNFYDEVFSYAAERGTLVDGLPLMVSASQRGLPSWIRGIDPGMGSFLRGALEETRVKGASPLERLIRADNRLNERLERELGERDKRVVGQDLAIFSSRVWDLDAIVEGIHTRLSSRGIGLPALPAPKSMTGGARRTLQIGRTPAPDWVDGVA